MSVREVHDRPVGVLTFVGSGEMSEAILEVVLDAAALAGLEASIGETRMKLRTSTAER